MHKDVDCLSRAPINDETDNYLENKVYGVRIFPNEPWNWRESCKNDTESIEMMDAKDKKAGFSLVNDVVYFNDRLYVQVSKRGEIIKLTHETTTAHAEVVPTGLKIEENYYWPKMQDDISSFIKTCETCMRNKPE